MGSNIFTHLLDLVLEKHTASKNIKKEGEHIEQSRSSLKNSQGSATFHDPDNRMLTQLHESFWKTSGNQYIQSITQSVKGMGGVGKTTLARQYISTYTHEYEKAWWLEAEKEPDIINGLATLAHELALNSVENMPAERRAKAALNAISQHKGEKPYLLVYDNVDNKALLQEWLPSGGSHILLTSRQGNWGDIAKEFPLDVWETHIGADYLKIRFTDAGRTVPPRPELERLTTELGGLPLALDHAASHLIDQAFVSVDDYLKDLKKHLKACPEADRYERSVSATFQIALKALKKKKGGKDALEFLNLIAHLGPHRMGKAQLESLSKFQKLKFEHLSLATQYALLQCSDTDTGEVLHMHRLVALVTQNLQGKSAPNCQGKALLWLWSELKNTDPQDPKDMSLYAALGPYIRTLESVYDGPTQQCWTDARNAHFGLLNHLGANEINLQGNYTEAARLFKTNLSQAKRDLEPNDFKLALVFNNLANSYEVQGRLEKAEPLHLKTLEILEKTLDPDDPQIATSLNNLASLYQTQGRFKEAEPLYYKALKILEKAYSPDHPDVANSLNNLAELYREQGRLEEAEPLHLRALDIREKALGPDHPSVATSLDNLALIYQGLDHIEEAEPLHLRALEIREKILRPDHPDVATSLNNLALVYQEQGGIEKAEPLHLRALDIRRKALGPDHPDVAMGLNNLACLYQAQGHLEKAEKKLVRAPSILKARLPEDHPNIKLVEDNLALCREEMARDSQ